MKKVKAVLANLLALILVSMIFFTLKEKKSIASESTSTSSAIFVNEPNTLITEFRQITFVGAKSGEGYFSPDGKKMIFQSEREPGNPFYQMFVMDLQNGETTRVSPGKGKTTCGWIHPSMKKVLYSSTHLDAETAKKASAEIENRKKAVKGRYSWSFDENYDIFESDMNGKNIKRLTKAKGYDAEGSYSPDGKWIAFASNRAGYSEKLEGDDAKLFAQDPSYMMDIYIMKADGSQVKRLTTAKGYDGGPFFSADGKKITWRRFAPNGSTAEIYTMNVDGSEQKPLTHMKSMSWAPFFHPSGDYVVFTSSVLGYSNFELFIVDSLGKHDPVRVTFMDDFDGLPVFTPDGNQLSWTHRNQKGESQIMMAKWDDQQARKLLGLAAADPAGVGALSGLMSAEDAKKWVYYLASPDFQGRATGAESEKVYTEKFVQLFKSWGFVGGTADGKFLDVFEFTSGVKLGAKNSLEVVGSFKKQYSLSEDYEPLSFSATGSFQEAPLVFAGYGIKAPASDKEPAYDSYKGLDVKGKWVIVLTDLPEDVSPQRRQYLNIYSRLQHKITVAKNQGAVGVIFTHGPLNNIPENFGKMKFEGSLSDGSIAVLRLSSRATGELIKYAGRNLSQIQKDLDKEVNDSEKVGGFVIPSAYLKSQIDLQIEKSKGVNVIAKLPVMDSKLASKGALMIGAHGDHLGHGEFGNSLAKKEEAGKAHLGADDNASGVAGVMATAHYYANLKRKYTNSLKRDLYFAIWSGEEMGTLGSHHFIKSLVKNNFEAYLNMDMIGRFKDRLFVQGVGSGDQWISMTEKIAAITAVPLVIQEDPYLPTDSMAFYLANVPTINLFTGSHVDYHTPRDTPELINYEGLAKTLQVLRAFVDSFESSAAPIMKYQKVGSSQAKLEGRSFRVYLGTIPDYSQEGIKGVKISGSSKESPAEQAGLKEKDLIVEFDGTRIENLYDYVYTLQSVKPNKETSIKVMRDGKLLDLKITPKLKD